MALDRHGAHGIEIVDSKRVGFLVRDGDHAGIMGICGVDVDNVVMDTIVYMIFMIIISH